MNTTTEHTPMSKTEAWLRTARLQFYPMAWIAYTLGAACAGTISGDFHIKPYLSGYLCLFLLELLTVLLNDYFDYNTDKLNQNPSLYSGGSRTLVEQHLSFQEVRAGIITVTLLLLLSIYLLVRVSPNVPAVGIVGLIFLGIFFGAADTAPPIKFCYRGLGELVVGITHSPYVLLAGFFFQVGKMNVSTPWLLSLPLFFAIMAAILLAALPDYSADKAVSKRTAAVLFGPKSAAIVAMFCVIAAAVSAGALVMFDILSGPGVWLFLVCILHANILLTAIAEVIRHQRFDCRIDEALKRALSYIIWFGFIPLLALLW